MRRSALRLVSCALAGAAIVLGTAPAASAGPAHDPGRERPGASSAASMHSPEQTNNLGRKLG